MPVMAIIMVSPLAALFLFWYMPFETALFTYIGILIVAGFCYYVMFQSMRTKAKTGLEGMIGGEAVVIERIDREGKIRFKNEIWTATARGEKITEGKHVKIVGAKGLVLIVESLPEDQKKSKLRAT